MGIDKAILEYRYINLCELCPRRRWPPALPSEAQVARGPDPPPAAVRLEAKDPRLGVVEVVQGHLVRRDGGVPFRRPRVEAIDPDPALAVRDADHAVRALVQLPPDGPASVQLRQARVRHEPDDLPLSDRLAGRPHGPLEQLVGLAELDVLVQVHRREAGEDDETGLGLLDFFIQHVQY